jgi:protein-S-isoprenylcysteine O-methyltransferase Ste14
MNNRKFYFFLAAQILAAALLLRGLSLWPGGWNLSRYIGFALVVAGLALVFTARYQLGKSFSVTPQARALVTHGLYSRIRNPIYVFGSLAVLGIILILQRPYLWFLLAVLIPVQALRARREAAVLEEKFGESYREYRRKTWF